MGDIEFIEVPEALVPILGEPGPGTRCWRRFGKEEDAREWFEAVMRTCAPDGGVSPGGVAMFARVSRAGVHKRVSEARITAFMFHQVEGVTLLTKREKLAFGGRATQCYIPVKECRSWAELLDRLPRAAMRVARSLVSPV